MASLPPRSSSLHRQTSEAQGTESQSLAVSPERPQTPDISTSTEGTDPSLPAVNETSTPGSAATRQLERELSRQISSVEPDSSPTAKEEEEKEAQDEAKKDEEEPRKCWICFTDETEDTPLSSEWRSPCPCALTAHESCLLDWIADLQAPGDRSRAFTNKRIFCPQCKSQIHVVRPQNAVVKAARACEHAMARALVPGLVTIFGGSMWTGSMVYGMSTLYTVFGSVEANAILGRMVIMDSGGFEMSIPDARFLFRLLLPFTVPLRGWSWSLSLAVPLIPYALVLSRTKWGTMALPGLSILFLTGSDEQSWFRNPTWPPDAAATFILLPFVRTAYYGLYDYFFAGLERRWYNELAPRAGEGSDNEEEDGNEGHDHEHEEVVLEVNLQLDLMDDDDDDDEEPEEPEVPEEAAEQAVPDIPIAHGADMGQEAVNVPDQNQENNIPGPDPAPIAAAVAPPPAQIAAGPDALQERGNGLVLSATRIADTIIGALLFPSVSAAMGYLIKLTFPRSWTAGTWATGRTGLLQEQWGRTVVGGCAFVVMKDALMLYVKWKTAQTHRSRKVLDYAGKKKRASA